MQIVFLCAYNDESCIQVRALPRLNFFVENVLSDTSIENYRDISAIKIT